MGRSVVETVEIRLLGPVAVVRAGETISLPRSRKVRALLAYLALSPHPVSRTRLCDLLWDVPNDPRGELRWCLSKLRGILDTEKRPRIVTDGDLVSLDLSDADVDALAVERAARTGFDRIPQAELGELCDRFAGDLLDGAAIDGNPELTGWMAAQRNRYRTLHVELLRALVARTGPEETFRRLEAWLQVAPFDPQAHEVLFEALARVGRLRDGDEHLATTIRSFEAEGMEWTALRDRWQTIRSATAAPRIEVAAPAPVERPVRRRAAVAVMPFVDRSSGGSSGGAPGSARLADGLTEDIIMQLARLRLLFVIARGSVYALAERGVGPQEAARVLAVDYFVSGSVQRTGDRVMLSIELVDAHSGAIVWTEAIDGVADDTLSVLDAIVKRVVAAIAEEIESEETRRAVLKAPSSLDAWEAYHRGLWHMYKFNGPDNRHAEQFFRAALDLDPTFARAHAGLSFTHFQNAFLDLTPDRARQIELAFDAANHSLSADNHDPAAHWAMGRALWLRGEHGESLSELERSIELSPNFALGHYTLGFVHSQKGDPKAAIASTNYSRQLSPFDPLQFAMLASRALAHVRLDERSEAAEWAVKATARPNAHAHILATAASCLSLAHREDEARRYVARIRLRLPTYSIEDFLRAFHFDADIERLFRSSARSISFE
jgi:TolB-like protein/DNA-binding SARP family transcriptional activator